MTSAPSASVFCIFTRGASAGITIVAGTPSRRAAQATPCAWLPDENATTPALRCAASSCARRLYAPRNLNEPMCCRVSSLSRTRPPVSSSSGVSASSGVRRAWPSRRAAAARTSSKSGSRVASLAAIEAILAFSHHERVSVPDSLPFGCEPVCHGCRHRQLDASASLAQKASYLARVLGPWADRIAPVASPAPTRRLGYRDRVTLTAGWNLQDGWRFGLVRRDELIPIHDCPVHTPRVRALVHLLVERLPPATVLPLAYLHVCGAQATLIVKSHQTDVALLDPVREGLAATGLEGLWLHQHPSAGRKLFARSGWKLAWGSARSRDTHGLLHGPTAFAQALPELHHASLDAARAHLRPAPGVAVLDLYCGYGASLRAWTAAGSAALGVELSGEAVELC